MPFYSASLASQQVLSKSFDLRIACQRICDLIAFLYGCLGMLFIHICSTFVDTILVERAFLCLQDVVATGQIGEDPTVHIWDASSKQTLSVIHGYHKTGVCSVNFSSSGRYLLTVGLDDTHSLAVWKWADGWFTSVVVDAPLKLFVWLTVKCALALSLHSFHSVSLKYI